MTRTPRDELLPDNRSSKLLQVWVDPIPLDEAALQHTLARARRLTVRRRRWRAVGKALPVVAVALAVLSTAAGFWTWSGQNSEEELSIGNTIQVIEQRSSYEPGEVRAAIGRLHAGCKAFLVRLRAAEGLPSGTVDSLLAALQGAEPKRVVVPRGFAALERRLIDGGALRPEDVPMLVQAIEAGIYLVRETARRNPEFAGDAKQFCARLKNTILKASE